MLFTIYGAVYLKKYFIISFWVMDVCNVIVETIFSFPTLCIQFLSMATNDNLGWSIDPTYLMDFFENISGNPTEMILIRAENEEAILY